MEKSYKSAKIFTQSISTKKYFFNQSPLTTGSQYFTDPYFPPNDQSLLGLDNNQVRSITNLAEDTKKNFSNLSWHRAYDILKGPVLFDKEICFEDVQQGNIGNCYFLAAIAAVAKYPAAIYRLFRTKQANQAGYYEINFFIQGEWQVVIVDDFIPYYSATKKYFTVSPKKHELWVILLEKAWAKINGSYYGSIAGYSSQAINAILGTNADFYLVEPTVDRFSMLVKAIKEGLIVITDSNHSADESKGLVSGHAYTMIDAFKLTTKTGREKRVVQLRNPWGRKEWVGSFSNGSIQPLNGKPAIDLKHREYGIFFMPYEDYVKLYSSYYIADFSFDYNFVHFPALSGSDLKLGNIYRLQVTEQGRYTFNINCVTNSYKRQVDNEKLVLFVLCKYSGNKIEVTHVESLNSQLLFRSLDLLKGNYLAWIFTNTEGPQADPVLGLSLRVYSKQQFYAKYLGTDTNNSLLRTIFISETDNKIQGAPKQSDLQFTYLTYPHSPNLIIYRLDNYYQNRKITLKVNRYKNILYWEQNKSEAIELLPNQYSLNILIGFSGTTTGLDGYYDSSYNHSQTLSKFESFNDDCIIDSRNFMEATTFFPQENLYAPEGFSNNEITADLVFDSYDPINYIKQYLGKIDIRLEIEFNKLLPFKNENEFVLSETDDFIYAGQVKNRNRDGVGIDLKKDKTWYLGMFKNNRLNGEGYIVKDEKVIRRGTFKDGLLEGYGIMFYSDGGQSEGMFKNGNLNGQATLTYADGKVVKGIFKDNVLQVYN